MFLGRFNVLCAVRYVIVHHGHGDGNFLLFIFPLNQRPNNGQALLQALERPFHFFGRPANAPVRIEQDTVGGSKFGDAQVIPQYDVFPLGLFHRLFDALHTLGIPLIGRCSANVGQLFRLSGPIVVGEGNVQQHLGIIFLLRPTCNGCHARRRRRTARAVHVTLIQLQRLGMPFLGQINVSQIQERIGNSIAAHFSDAIKDFLGLDEFSAFGKNRSNAIGSVGIGIVAG